MENNDFVCPYCRGQLKPHVKITLAARKKDGTRGMILFNPKLGEYDIYHHPSFKLVDGELLDILCPVCHANLADKTVAKNLAKILMIDEKGEEYQIYFSEIVGMKCTYQIKGDTVEAYGEDAGEYQNYWGVSPRY